ncbi:CVNH domain-containing protein [Leptolyngbya sp. AN02str]
MGLFVLALGLVLHLKTPPTGTISAPASASSSLASQPEAAHTVMNISHLPASTYQDSCENISISGDLLSAFCRTRSGDFVQTSIVLRGIDNVNGMLVATNFTQPSTYQDSCNQLSINGNILTAFCETGDGRKKQTTISLSGIGNDDGMLVYPGHE